MHGDIREKWIHIHSCHVWGKMENNLLNDGKLITDAWRVIWRLWREMDSYSFLPCLTNKQTNKQKQVIE